jgi:hypothetical protein
MGPMLKSLKLEGVGPVRGLTASFGDRLNVLTGDNGLGKSFLLDVCFWALTGTWPGGRTALPVPNGKKHTPTISYQVVGKTGKPKDKTCEFDFHSQTWTKGQGRPVMPGLVVYAAVDGSFAVWDPARNYWRDPTSGVKEGEDQPRAYQFSPDTLANGLKEGERVLCNGLVQDWVNWYYEQAHIGVVGSKSGSRSSSVSGAGSIINPFEYLEDVVALLSHPLEPMTCGKPRRVYIDQPRKYPVLTMPYGEVAYPHWSAGVRRVISFAYLLVWAWYEHVQAAELRNEVAENRLILIVDEIEAHLHPKWQRTILPALLQVVQKLQAQVDVQVFAATHSPLILASLEPHFDYEKDKLFWFDLKDEIVHFTDYPWAIQGDVVGWLTSEIFGLRQARSQEGEAAVEAAEAFMRNDSAQLPSHLDTKPKIQKELERTLPGMDPFWPRWMLEAKG